MSLGPWGLVAGLTLALLVLIEAGSLERPLQSLAGWLGVLRRGLPAPDLLGLIIIGRSPENAAFDHHCFHQI